MMPDEELIGYVELHSQTERALFHRDDVQRIIALSGNSYKLQGVSEWVTFRYDSAKHLCDEARARLRRAALRDKLHVIQGGRS